MKLSKAIIPYLPPTLRKKLVRANLPEFKQELPGITFRKAKSLTEQNTCLRLVNDVYINAGYIKGNIGEGLRKTPQHDNPDTAVFMATIFNTHQKEIPIYTASLFPDSSLGIPSDIGFKKQIDLLRASGKRIVEVGCLASHPHYRKNNKNIPMIMNRTLMQYARKQLKADILLITIQLNHLQVYEDILLFKSMGKIKSFKKSVFDYEDDNPAIALYIDLNTAPQEFYKIYGNKPINKNLYHFFFGEN